MEVAKTPRDLKTCRARVWQEDWWPMPWDNCRRTLYTESQRPNHYIWFEGERSKRDAKMKNECKKDAAKSPRHVKTSRARVWQEDWWPMPWDYCRRTAFTETRSPTYTWHEEKEKCKRDAKMNRYRQYQVHFYGTPEEKETKHAGMRAELKEQLEQLEPPHKQFVKRVGETLEVAERGRQEEERLRERDNRRKRFLATFKESNQVLIDSHILERRDRKLAELNAEQKRLTLNPINWSHSLW